MSPVASNLKFGQSYLLQNHDLVMDEDTRYSLRVKDLVDNQRPREKLQAHGPDSLNLAELVAVILGVGTKNEEILTMSHRIIKEYGEKSISTETNPQKLTNALNISTGKACQLVASFELGRRFFAQAAGKSVYVRNARQAYHYLHDMGAANKEQLRGLYLNSRYRVIHDEVISVGSLTANITHPREVFRPAIEHGAVAVILAHNHPSGSLKPTPADLSVTGQLVVAGQVLGLEVLDHLIVTNNSFTRIELGGSDA
jgi:DNA repair protein RadC